MDARGCSPGQVKETAEKLGGHKGEGAQRREEVEKSKQQHLYWEGISEEGKKGSRSRIQKVKTRWGFGLLSTPEARKEERGGE